TALRGISGEQLSPGIRRPARHRLPARHHRPYSERAALRLPARLDGGVAVLRDQRVSGDDADDAGREQPGTRGVRAVPGQTLLSDRAELLDGDHSLLAGVLCT